MPLVLIRNGPSATPPAGGGAPTPRSTPSAASAPVPPWKLASDTRSSATSTTTSSTTTVPPTTTQPPATTDPPTTDPAQDVAAHLAPAPDPAPAASPPATAAPAAASGAVHYGQVTFYDHPAGTCASPYLPFGTEVRVTNPANGASVTCLVNDREADTARSIDLATATFAEIAPLSQGVIDAQLVW